MKEIPDGELSDETESDEDPVEEADCNADGEMVID